jgi:CHAT domain-containing protein/tetratricopeptide (TPR) repeat protein
MRGQVNGKKSHPNREMIVAYVTGSCSAEGKKVIEDHCLDCLTCRTQLSVLLHLIVSPADEEEQLELEPLLPLGEQAAWQAREIIRQEEGRDRRMPSPRSDLVKGIQVLRPILKPALVIVALLAGSMALYFAGWRQAPEESTLSRLREIYSNTRLLQARVTGGFSYQNFVVTRGPGDSPGIDESQRVALLAEINQEVHANPKAANRHILGRLFMLQGDLEPAEQQFLLALKESQRDARLHSDLGALYYERSRKKGHEDRQLLEKAAEYTSNAVKFDPKISEAWFNRALCYEHMHLFLQAESDWKQFLTLDSNSGWAEEAREHLKKLSERSARLEKLEQTVQAEFLVAEAAGDEIKMRELVNRHFIPAQNLAMDQIFDRYLAVSIAGEKGQADQNLRSLKRIGQLISEIKRDRFVADAVDFAARGNLAVKREVQAIRQMLQQARQEHSRGKTSAACELYTKAHQAAERIGDYCHAEMTALGIARYYHNKDESKELVKLRNELVSDSRRRSHQQIYAKALLAQANAEGAEQQFSRELKSSQEAAEISKKLGDTETVINSLRFVGSAYQHLGDYEPAISHFYEAIALLGDSQVKPIRAATAFDELGDTLFRMGKYLTALSYQGEAVLMCERSGNATVLAYMIQRLGISYGMLERDEEAKQHLNKAVALTDAITDKAARLHLKADLYTRFGDFYLQRNKVGEAIATYNRAIENVDPEDNRFYLSTIRQGLAKAYMAHGQNAEAEAELKESIRLTEEAREQISDARSRNTFLASQQSVYRAMVNFQFSNKNDPARAFNYAEIAKGRDLLDALAGSTQVSASDGQVTLALSHSETPLTLEQVQRALPSNVQFLQYVMGENQLMIWFVKRDRLATAKADVSATDLRNKVRAYLDELRTRGNLENLNRQASDLYRLLIAPVSQQLDPNSSLCIIPDGVLRDLPFAALFSPETHRYLVEDFSLIINPSASVFARTLEISCSKPRSESEPFLGLGNPRFNQQRFPQLHPLPASDQELERIQSFYPKRLILNRKQATESELVKQIGNYEIVHLATHSVSNKQSSLLSAIVLADESASAVGERNPRRVAFDGTLQAHEIYRLRLDRTRLVLLSSCSSGLGDQMRNEAMSGLAQAFLVAGVPSVIASLWDIDDESTAELMEKLHASHRVKRLAFGQALRAAQISFLQTAPPRRRHPYYWATFIVTGDGLAD